MEKLFNLAKTNYLIAIPQSTGLRRILGLHLSYRLTLSSLVHLLPKLSVQDTLTQRLIPLASLGDWQGGVFGISCSGSHRPLVPLKLVGIMAGHWHESSGVNDM